jgi:hypothetical protein
MYNSAMATKTKTPFFKELSDDALREEYAGYRNLAYNNAAMAASGAVNLRRAAYQMHHLMRCVEIIEAIARKRGMRLA